MRRVLRRLALGAALVAVLAFPASSGAVVSVGHSGWFWGSPLPQGDTLRAIDFAGARGYAVGDFGTLIRTDDGGATWSGVPTGVTVDLGRLRVVTADTIVISGGCAVRRSDNGGQTFRRLPWTASDARCTAGVRSLAFPSANVGYLYLGNGNVLRSDDGGATWARRTAVPGTRATQSNSDPEDIAFTSVDDGYATTSAGTVFGTTDGGSTWTPLANPGQALHGLFFLDASTGYAVGAGSTVLRTTNGGATWESRNVPVDAELTSIRCVSDATCLVTTAGGDQLLRTTDGGLTWTSLSPATAKLFAAAFSSESRALAVGEAGNTVLSDNGGVNYKPVGGDLAGDFRRLKASTSRVAYTFGPGGDLARTTDGGQSWKEMDAATSDNLVDVAFPSVETGFALDSVGQLLRTDNAGASWKILNTGTTQHPRAVLALDKRRILLVGPLGVRRSTNGGNGFQGNRQKRVLGAALFHVDRAGSAIFAFGDRAIVTSRNGGATWRRVKLPDKRADLVSLDFVSPRIGYALDTAGRVWRTQSTGRRWREVLGIGTEVGYDLVFSDARHGYVTIDEFGDETSGFVLRTDDAGHSWRPQLVDAQPLRHDGLAAPTRNDAFVLARGDRVFATSTGGDNGARSRLTIRARSRRLAKPGLARIDGKLTPARGGEQVVLSRRARGERRWLFETLTVASNGTFTAVADLRRSSVFVAQWAGDQDRIGDGTPTLNVRVRGR